MLVRSTEKLDRLREANVLGFRTERRHDCTTPRTFEVVFYVSNPPDRMNPISFDEFAKELNLSDDERIAAIVIMFERLVASNEFFAMRCAETIHIGELALQELARLSGEESVEHVYARRLLYGTFVGRFLGEMPINTPEQVAHEFFKDVDQKDLHRLFLECVVKGKLSVPEVTDIWLTAAQTRAKSEHRKYCAWDILDAIYTASHRESMVSEETRGNFIAKCLIVEEFLLLTRGKFVGWEHLASERREVVSDERTMKLLGQSARKECAAALDEELATTTLVGGHIGSATEALSNYQFLYDLEDRRGRKSWYATNLAAVIRQALPRAVRLCQFGVAAGLAAQVGMANECIANTKLAAEVGQTIGLDFARP